MKMTCPHCGVVGTAPGSMPGGKVRCPQCDKVFMLMEQKIACPHCGVDGSAEGALPGTKLRCPRCEKVFLLMPERLAGESVRGVVAADMEGAMATTVTATGVEVSAGPELLSPVVELERMAEPVTGVLPENVPEAEAEPIVEPEAEVELEMVARLEEAPGPEPIVEPVAEIEPELIAEPEPEPELLVETEVVVEPEPAAEAEGSGPAEQVAVIEDGEAGVTVEVIFEPVVECAEEVFGEIEVEAEIIVPEAEPVAEVGAVESTAMPTDVCAGCGESFHPEFLQEVDSKLYCGVCQLRSAAMDAGKQAAKSGDRKLWGMPAVLILLGLLALVVLALMTFGLI